MRKTLLSLVVTMALLLIAPISMAKSLMQVYYGALRNDPTFKKAESIWLSERENLAIAGSQYLPTFTITGNERLNYWQNMPVRGIITLNGSFWSDQVSLTASQPIFNAAAWEAIKGARASVKAAAANYSAAAQDLIVRTANAYFAVLEAYETLQFTNANKRAVWRQLETSRQKFKVGLIAITGVYDAQSRFDQAVAAEIENQNALENKIEELRAITGIHYFTLKGIRDQVPLIRPKPANISVWARKSEIDNYSIKAAEFSVISARENIAEAQDARMPVVDLVSQYSDARSNGHPATTPTRQQQVYVGLSVSVPIVQGGLVIAQTKQARYDYLTANHQLEFTERSVVTQTRQAYLGVVSGISKVKADKESIKSAENAFKATEAGYQVGTRTMVDVLDDLTAVYRGENEYAAAQFSYLSNIIALKQAAGTLNVKDLEIISRWLSKRVRLPRESKTYEQLKAEPVGTGGYKFEKFGNSVDSDIDSILNDEKSKKTEPEKKTDQNGGADINKEATITPETKTSANTEVTPETKKKPKSDAMLNNENKKQSNQTKETTIMPEPKTSPNIEVTPETKKKPTSDVMPNHENNKKRDQTKEIMQKSTLHESHKPYFAIQVLEARKLKDAQHFIRLHQSNKKLYVVREKDFYKVLYGHYPTISKAYLALEKNMPKAFKYHRVWIATLRSEVPVISNIESKSQSHHRRHALKLPKPRRSGIRHHASGLKARKFHRMESKHHMSRLELPNPHRSKLRHHEDRLALPKPI